MEQWLLNQGPLGVALAVAMWVIKKLYGDLQTARDNERTALLDLLQSRNSERSDDS